MKPTAYSPRPTVSGLLAAFTLVELMVVVAVIAMLLMLLIPNIRTMREKAWSAHCQNNLRQYGIAMNQYMADWNGDFVYAGAGSLSAKGTNISVGSGGWQTLQSGVLSPSRYYAGIQGRDGLASSSKQSWQDMIAGYLPGGVTIQSLSGGEPSVRVCPAIMQQLRNGNFFDPEAPNFKGFRYTTDNQGNELLKADFESRRTGYTNSDLILDSAFTTYAINFNKTGKSKTNIPENVIAFIDWNARDGWWATLGYTTWQFNGTNSQGVAVVQDAPKWTNAWWLTEVGFHHRIGNEYGANYVAMDGHVGWVSSNAISVTNFTTGM